MDLLVICIVVVLLVALAVYAVRQIGGIDNNIRGIIIALIILLAIVFIGHRAGLF